MTTLMLRSESLRTISAPMPLEPPVMRTISCVQSQEGSSSKLLRLRVERCELSRWRNFHVHSMQVGMRNALDDKKLCSRSKVLGSSARREAMMGDIKEDNGQSVSVVMGAFL